MNEMYRMVKILKDNYSLDELQERFDATTEDLEYGITTYVEDNFDHVAQVLREDLWFVNGY